MNMNLEQIRAASALAYANADGNKRGSEGGEVVRKLPALIMGNGLLATAAFAYQKEYDDYPKSLRKFEKKHHRAPSEGEDKNLHSGYKACFDWITLHLADTHRKIIPAECKTLKDLLDHLTTKADSRTLKLATDETLAWLTYARRFVVKAGRREEGEMNGGEDDSAD